MERKQRPLTWEELVAMDLTSRIIELYHTNDGPDDGYCARGKIRYVTIENGWCNVHCSTVTERKVKDGAFDQLSENHGWMCRCSVSMTPDPTIDDLGVVRFWFFPGTCIRIHNADYPLT